MGKDNRIAVRLTDKEKQTIQAKAKKSPHLYELLQSELDVERQAGARARNKSKEWSG